MGQHAGHAVHGQPQLVDDLPARGAQNQIHGGVAPHFDLKVVPQSAQVGLEEAGHAAQQGIGPQPQVLRRAVGPDQDGFLRQDQHHVDFRLLVDHGGAQFPAEEERARADLRPLEE